MVLSTLSNTAVEEVAAAATGPVWFQLYVYRDRRATEGLVRRAEAAGCRALVLTVDAPLLGRRERDVRNRFRLPPGLAVANLLPVGLRRPAAGRRRLGARRLCRVAARPVAVLEGPRVAALAHLPAAGGQGDRPPRRRPPRRRRRGGRAWWCRTTAAASSTPRRPPWTCCPRSPTPSPATAPDRGATSTAACGAAPTWSRRWPSAPARCWWGARSSGGSRRGARPAPRRSCASCATSSTSPWPLRRPHRGRHHPRPGAAVPAGYGQPVKAAVSWIGRKGVPGGLT